VPTPVHVIADTVTRFGVLVGRLRTGSETVIAGQFRLALACWLLRAEAEVVHLHSR